jgi:predicted phosphoribosyltransferase
LPAITSSAADCVTFDVRLGIVLAPLQSMRIPASGPVRYANRREAGRVLADRLADYAGRDDVVVLGLPRGGIPVAYEVARALNAPLDVFVVRKLGLPGHPEYAMGAIASGGVRVLNDEAIRQLRIPPSTVEAVAHAEQQELERRERAYRGTRPAAAVEGRIVILVDDGLATGSTMRAAVLAIRRRLPSQIVVAAPVGARETCRTMNEVADEVICARMPEPFNAVGLWYQNFDQTSDDEVRRLLAQSSNGGTFKRSA